MFYRVLTDMEIATQVAGLINTHNNLATRRRGVDILEGKSVYIVETHGNRVIGAVGLDKKCSSLTEIKHLVVYPQWRKQGLARFLLQKAITLCNSPLMFATIRHNNKSSLTLFERMGFSKAGEYLAKDIHGNHKVVLTTRTAPKWKTQKNSTSKYASLGGIKQETSQLLRNSMDMSRTA